ncbi:MAG: ABC transporter permease [Thermoplasmata archaeon]
MGVGVYLAKRGLFLLITLAIATYAVVVIANQGGLIDNILIQEIRLAVSQELANDPAFQRLPPEERMEIFNQTVQRRIHARGLDQPFITKSFRQTFDALTLNLGQAQGTYGTGSLKLVTIIMDRLPRTVLLFTTGTVAAAALGIWIGLWMARKALTTFDRGMTVFAVTTLVVPAWVFGIFFILLLAFAFPIFPPGGFVSAPAPQDPWGNFLDRMYHLALPLLTWVFATFGGWAYITRNLVLQIMDEDFVHAARAKGLPESVVLNRYVLRAASPPIVTSVALALIASWTGAIITELVFNWPGLGRLFFEAIVNTDPPTIIALTIIYAYLFVATIFVLDVIYSLLDPRIRALGRR